MCWNAPVSYASFAFGMFMVYKLWTRPVSEVLNKNYDYWNALFIFAFVSMQLGEGLIHQGMQWGKWIIWLSVIFQPMAQCLGAAYFGGHSGWYIWAILCALVAPFLKIDNVVRRGASGHLAWSVRTEPMQSVFTVIYMVGAIAPLLFMSPLLHYGVLAFYMVLSMMYSLYNFYNTREWSSMWCFFACVFSLIAYSVNSK